MTTDKIGHGFILTKDLYLKECLPQAGNTCDTAIECDVLIIEIFEGGCSKMFMC